MRIGVNLLWCVPGEVGGSEEYLARQLIGLAEAAPDVAADTTLFVLPAFAIAHPELGGYRQVVATFDGASRARRVSGEAGWLRTATTGFDLVHHGGGTAPIGARRPYVLTVHDLQYLTFPQNFSKLKLAYLRMTMPRSAGGAAAVAVPSEYVRRTVVEAFNVPQGRVHVVAHGVEPDLAEQVTDDETVRSRYRLGDGPYVVYPAVTHPHKNHRLLADLLRGPWRERDLRIVLCGGIGASEAEIAVDDRRLLRLGRVPSADRNGLIAGALAMVFPSLYEGFGAPLIEAMALGTPVVCTDAGSLPEVAATAAVVRPPTVEAWSSALDEVEARRAELIDAGHRRVAEFTTRRSGAALADVYRTVLES